MEKKEKVTYSTAKLDDRRFNCVFDVFFSVSICVCPCVYVVKIFGRKVVQAFLPSSSMNNCIWINKGFNLTKDLAPRRTQKANASVMNHLVILTTPGGSCLDIQWTSKCIQDHNSK